MSSDLARDLLVDGFTRIAEGVPAVAAGLTVDQLLWRPGPEANHVAWLLWHLSRQQDAQVAALVDGEQAWTADDFVTRFDLPYDADTHGYGMSAADVGAFTVSDPGLFDTYQRATFDRTEQALAQLGADDYARVIDDSWDPPVTVASRLVSVLDDAAKHLGQAEYVKGLLPPK